MSDTYPRFTIAAIQAASVLFDREKTTDKAVSLIEQAAEKRAVIIGFPECFIPGQPGIWFHAKKFNPFPSQGKFFTELYKCAVEVPSPTTDELCAAARKAHAFVVMGISERDKYYPGTLYISQLVISDKGEIAGLHRKLVPTGAEKLLYSSGDGSHFGVYNTPYGKLSCLNCGENVHDLYKYALIAMGTQIHVASWPSGSPFAHVKARSEGIHLDAVHVRQFAFEGKIFVISSSSIVDKQNIDVICDTEEDKGKIKPDSGGRSSIIGPNGIFLAGPVFEGEAILTANVSLEDCLPYKPSHNVLGHYTRWDVFSMNLNRKPLSPWGSMTKSTTDTNHVNNDLRNISEQLKEINQKLDGYDKRLSQLEDQNRSDI